MNWGTNAAKMRIAFGFVIATTNSFLATCGAGTDSVSCGPGTSGPLTAERRPRQPSADPDQIGDTYRFDHCECNFGGGEELPKSCGDGSDQHCECTQSA